MWNRLRLYEVGIAVNEVVSVILPVRDSFGEDGSLIRDLVCKVFKAKTINPPCPSGFGTTYAATGLFLRGDVKV